MTFAHESTPAEISPPGSFGRLSASDAWDLILEHTQRRSNGFLVLDARQEQAFRESHLEGAEPLSDARFQELLTTTPRRKTIVVYCELGHRSQEYAAAFAASGFSAVFSVDGGFAALAKEHAERQRAAAEAEAEALPVRYLVGDVVFACATIRNDGGVPELAEDALVAAPGARGVVVQVGSVEADPRQTVYAVRFEGSGGSLGPMVGCLPEELTQAPPTA